MSVSMDKFAPGLFRPSLQDTPPEQASREAAIGVGRHAVRLGWSEKELSDWLSRNYGRVWVKETGLNPGLDLKDVRKYVLQSFKKAGGAAGTTELDDTLSGYLKGYQRRVRPLARVVDKIPIIEDPKLQNEARQQPVRGKDGIKLGPKFWRLNKEERDWVLTHEIGHWISTKVGASAWTMEARKRNIDVWNVDELPWGQFNFEKAFAETFVITILKKREKRHQQWQQLVRDTAKKVGVRATTTLPKYKMNDLRFYDALPHYEPTSKTKAVQQKIGLQPDWRDLGSNRRFSAVLNRGPIIFMAKRDHGDTKTELHELGHFFYFEKADERGWRRVYRYLRKSAEHYEGNKNWFVVDGNPIFAGRGRVGEQEAFADLFAYYFLGKLSLEKGGYGEVMKILTRASSVALSECKNKKVRRTMKTTAKRRLAARIRRLETQCSKGGNLKEDYIDALEFSNMSSGGRHSSGEEPLLTDLIARVAKKLGGKRGLGLLGASAWSWVFPIEDALEKNAEIERAFFRAGFKRSGTTRIPIGDRVAQVWSHPDVKGISTWAYSVNNYPKVGMVRFEVTA